MKRAMLRLILVVLIVCSACAKGGDVAKARHEFSEADKELNDAWAKVTAGMSKPELDDLRQDQREWLEYRDYLATSPAATGAGGQGKLPKDSEEFLKMAAAMTRDRTSWLVGRMQHWNDESLTGIWSDSLGGSISILEQKGLIRFSIGTVRGQSLNMGEISGEAVWNRPIGWFSDKRVKATSDGEDHGETNLAFVLENHALHLTGANTGYYHGFNAYFDGIYVKIRNLSDAERNELLQQDSPAPNK